MHIGKLREEIEILDESNPDAALKKKADKTGMPLGILKKVFKRGVAGEQDIDQELIQPNGVWQE